MPKGLGGMSSLQTMNLFVLGKDKGGDLSELNGLKSLRGSLSIRELQFCTAADLKNAKYLEEKSGNQKLELHWDTDKKKLKLDGASDASDEGVLECLKQHSNVRKMSIQGFRGMKLCDWLSSNFLGGLVSIELRHCEKLQHLLPFDQFPYLKHLHLENLPNIEYIDNNSCVSSSTTFFPSLEKLRIIDMPKLKGWWRGEIPSKSAQYAASASLPKALHHLSKLRISGCPQLVSIPQHPPLQSLTIDGVGFQLFDMVIRMATNLAADSSSSSSLSKLSTLCIQNIDLEFLPQDLFCNMKDVESLSIQHCKNLQMSSSHFVGEEDDTVLYWKELGSLRNLSLRDIPKMEYLPKSLKYITTLELLDLTDCPNLVSIEGIGQLTSLLGLRIGGCPKLPLLSEEVGHLISLSHLFIWSCPNLTSLPEGISRLTSLSNLYIKDCPNLTSLPEGLCHLRSLRGGSRVSNCPKLRKQNKKVRGEEDCTEIKFVSPRRYAHPFPTIITNISTFSF